LWSSFVDSSSTNFYLEWVLTFAWLRLLFFLSLLLALTIFFVFLLSLGLFSSLFPIFEELFEPLGWFVVLFAHQKLLINFFVESAIPQKLFVEKADLFHLVFLRVQHFVLKQNFLSVCSKRCRSKLGF
jgi:hypothetical protein